jgi:hypothetical protein
MLNRLTALAKDMHPLNAGASLLRGNVGTALGQALPVGEMYQHPVNTALDVAAAASALKGASALTDVPGTIRNARLMKRVDRYMPNTSAASQAATGEGALPMTTGVDRYMPNSSAYSATNPPPRGIVPRAADSFSPDAPLPSDMPSSWHAFTDKERAAASPLERQQAGTLHKELAQMDADFQRRMTDQRGSVPVSLLVHPPMREAAAALYDALKRAAPGVGTAAKVGAGGGLLLREGQQTPPSTYTDALAALFGR